MKRSSHKLFAAAGALLLAPALLLNAAEATLTVQTDQPGVAINHGMWGIFFEDINLGADGGLYAELVKNRSFEFQSIKQNTWNNLTAWELVKDNIPTTLICDNMAGYFMQQGRIQAVIVGADRIAANGDTANKIGTYSVSILAKEHGIPFYVAAPFNTIDLATASGELIPIEQRAAREVTHVSGVQVTPHGVQIQNPAFDVTPAKNITAIITERGVLRVPFTESIRAMADEKPTAAELVSA